MSGKTGLQNFESVKGGGAIWEPKQSGSKKDNNLKPLEPSEVSYMIGHYLGSKHDIGKNNSTIHGFLLIEAGDDSHINGEMNDGKVNVWGSGVLDTLIQENVRPGEAVAIKWLGKKPTKDGDNEYHDWDVMKDPSVEPIDPITLKPLSQSTIPSGSNPVTEEKVETKPAEEVIMSDEDEDDLPF